MRHGKWRLAAATLGLCLLAAAVFQPVIDFDFLELDDPAYVTENRQVRSGLTREGFVWAWRSAGYAANWHPLTWLSHMLDVELFGLAPRGHHLTSLLLHLANAALLFRALQRMTGAAGKSLAVAALFAVHPLRVESVAWVAERKDVLSAFFWMLALNAYASHARAPSPRRYLAVSGLFACALAAKQMAVTLPLLLLLLDFWPLGRFAAAVRRGGFGALVAEKVPLVLLAAGAGALTLVAQSRGGMLVDLERLPAPARLANAAASAAGYVVNGFWPRGLSFFYPLEQGGAALAAGAAAAVALAAVTAAAWRLRRHHPWILTGWLWHLVALLPVLGILQVGQQAMADRYSYLPQIGLVVAAAWGVAALPGGLRRWRPAVAAAAVLAVAALALAAHRQTAHWRDGASLFEHALAVTEGNWLAENNYGFYLQRRGRLEEAVAHYEAALRLRPGLGSAQSNLGSVLARLGRLDEAIAHYRRAIALQPANEVAHFNLASACLRSGRLEEALAGFSAAARLKPSFADAHVRAGDVLERLGRRDAAAARYREALRQAPGHAEALRRLGRATVPASPGGT